MDCTFLQAPRRLYVRVEKETIEMKDNSMLALGYCRSPAYVLRMDILISHDSLQHKFFERFITAACLKDSHHTSGVSSFFHYCYTVIISALTRGINDVEKTEIKHCEYLSTKALCLSNWCNIIYNSITDILKNYPSEGHKPIRASVYSLDPAYYTPNKL